MDHITEAPEVTHVDSPLTEVFTYSFPIHEDDPGAPASVKAGSHRCA